MKKFFKRLIYWLKRPRKYCSRCCLFCKWYDVCKDDG